MVGTLRRLTDDGAAELAVRFYVRLPSEAPPEALAGAQREMIRDPRLGDPYWAGYQVSGSGGTPR